MTYPDKAETMVLLRKWEQLSLRVEALMDGVFNLFGHTPESNLFETTWSTFDAYTEALEAQIGAGDWLAWYQAENDMGSKGMRAGYDGKLKKIKSLNGLWWLIEQARERP